MRVLKILLLLQLFVFSGCLHDAAYESVPTSYYLDPSKDLKRIGRVALVELSNNTAVHQVSPNLTEALFQEVQKRQIFSLKKVCQADPMWKSLQLDMDSSYTFEELAQMRKTLKCDAVLIGTITVFEPYPHMVVGLRLRMIDLLDGQLLWGLEQVWDTTDKATQKRIKAYYNPRCLILHDENLSGQLGSVSSLKFFKYVAHETAETLVSDTEKQ